MSLTRFALPKAENPNPERLSLLGIVSRNMRDGLSHRSRRSGSNDRGYRCRGRGYFYTASCSDSLRNIKSDAELWIAKYTSDIPETRLKGIKVPWKNEQFGLL